MTSSRCRFTLTLLVLSIIAASTVAHAQTFSVLYNFGSKTGDPNQPYYSGIIAQGRDGNLYSTANGGANGAGAVFKITPAGTLTVLYSFTGGTDGGNPIAGLTLGADGNFYGTTVSGGTSGSGTIFKVTPGGALTPVYSFTGGSDGATPYAPPIQGTDGNLYGTTQRGGANTLGTVYKITLSGNLTTLYSFDNTHGDFPFAPLVLGTDGNFYGTASGGGTPGLGVAYKITASGKLTVLHNFAGGDGKELIGPLVQGGDGNFYGTASSGGTKNGGVVFKLTPTGKLTVLHNMNPTTDGQAPAAGLVQATDGNFYGVNAIGPGNGQGALFEITPKGKLSVLHQFDTTTGISPYVTPFQHTTGIIYGDTQLGGTGNISPCSVGQCGVFYAWNATTLAPFASLLSTSGRVGSKIGILGQGFSSSSVVKFGGGVQAKSFTRKGTTYISATVPAGAIDGKVTVTTGSTKLTSTQTFIVHNSWSSGAVLPTALQGPATGVIGGKVYVVGGATNSAVVAINQIYDPKTNKWTTGASMPTARFAAAGAVVNGILYVIGGNPNGSSQLSVVEAYDPATNTWSTKSPMPTARDSIGAVVEGGIIYVIGGYDNSSHRLATVESYNPAADTWAEDAPLLLAKSEPAVGLLGSTIVAAGGLTNSGTVTGDNEGYSATSNSWSALTADPTPRQAGCAASISGQLYFAGGTNGTPLNVVESFSATANKWTPLTSIPLAIVGPGSAEVNNLLYCFGGSNNGGLFQGTVYNNLQIYQP